MAAVLYMTQVADFYFLKNNMKDQYRICISSPPDREKLVAEIFFGDSQWAEINQERETLEVEFYSRANGEPWRIHYQDVIKSLNDAKQRLIGC